MQSRFLKLLGAVAVINILARLLGFGREVIIGYQYGTSYQADSIITAFTIPNFIYIVLGGAITTAFISVYSKLSGEARKSFVQTIFTGLGLLIGLLSLMFIVVPGFWIDLFFAGMSDEARKLTAGLFQWMAPATLFLALAMAFSGLLNVHEQYRLTSFSTLVFNAVFLVVGVALTPILLEYSYGLGASLGALLMLLILVVSTRKQQLVPLRFGFVKMPETKRFMKLAIPIMFGGATIQFYFFIQRIYASGLDEGVISALNYASKMTQFPQAVLMTSVTTIIYPLLAKAVGEGDTLKVRNAYQKGFRMLTLILIPATAFLFVYAREIIVFIFEYGDFDANSTNVTYPLLQVFSLTILGLALNTYITRFFYARESSYLPVMLNIISVFGVNVLVIELFIEKLGAGAIALGTVVGTIVNMVLLLIFAKLKFNLVPSSWGYVLKLILFIVLAVGAIGLSYLVPIDLTLITLMIGGTVTAVFVLGGLKVVK
ncbi:murein biosynthesis integral membrane protein MurJ [Ornithinibacillus californiensis]|uniref:murein biosynthesis integral membrane protein MurJ n=1 Tax=Ornithinibacillus californiensis TaxID=161536 RepID=UPI00064D79C4|nr:murein biosynthesis integral membrane protein MurJ [Ornithinibacillus californiensis]